MDFFDKITKGQRLLAKIVKDVIGFSDENQQVPKRKRGRPRKKPRIEEEILQIKAEPEEDMIIGYLSDNSDLELGELRSDLYGSGDEDSTPPDSPINMGTCFVNI